MNLRQTLAVPLRPASGLDECLPMIEPSKLSLIFDLPWPKLLSRQLALQVPQRPAVQW